jgi:hypothetical protein
MEEYKIDPERGERLTPRAMLAVGLILLGVSNLCGGAEMLLAPIAGPFASSAVGILLIVIAVRIYRGAKLLL